jgi:AcrR family transcriptional regulator
MKQTAAKVKMRDRARQARNDLYRGHILEAAEKVFADRGFESAKLQDISAGAGMSMGTIYAVFAGKEELFRAILNERGRELLALARRVADAAGAPRQALKALIEAYVGYFVEHPDFLRMHLRHGSSWVLGPTLSSQAQVALWKEIHELQAAIFRAGVEAGDFVDEDPAFLAKIFSAMDQVLLSDWVAGGMRAGREDLVGRLQRLAERVFVKDDEPRRRKTAG